MHTKRFAVTAAALTLIGCEGLFEPREPDVFLMLTPIAHMVGVLPPFEIHGATGEVFTTGWVVTGTPCYGFAPQATRFDRVLVVTLVFRPEGEGCVQAGLEWEYRIAVRNVPPGTWDVRVRTQHVGWPADEVVRANVIVR